MDGLFETYGIDLEQIMSDARENGNTAFADVIQRQLDNLQTCYDVIAQKYSSTGGENPWKIDAEYLQTLLK